MEFKGSNLRVARLFAAKSLDDIAIRVGKTRQYIHKLEVDAQANPTAALVSSLAEAVDVEPEFFENAGLPIIHDESVHFRKLFTTRAVIKHVAIAKAQIFEHVVNYLGRQLRLPAIAFGEQVKPRGMDEVERSAENFRTTLGLGQGPISNITRIAENCGAVVTTFWGVSEHIDALSVASARPLIVRNEAKRSPLRQRFDIAHEIGHLMMHQGVVTGDHATEGEANRFASAFLMPRSMMVKFFPVPRGRRLSWPALAEFKRTWKVSKAAILYRARQLDLLDEQQYRTGFIHLKQTGQAREESEDQEFDFENPEVVQNCVNVLYERKGLSYDDLARSLALKTSILKSLGIVPSTAEASKSQRGADVIPLRKFS